MNILGIDPGSVQSGLVIYDPKLEVIVEGMIVGNGDLLGMLAGFDCGICVIEDMRPHPMTTRAGHSYIARDAITVQRYLGRLQERWLINTGNEAEMIDRSVVTAHFSANRKKVGSKDSQIMKALLMRFGPKGTKGAPGPTYGMASHMWQALAVAVTYADRQPLLNRLNVKSLS